MRFVDKVKLSSALVFGLLITGAGSAPAQAQIIGSPSPPEQTWTTQLFGLSNDDAGSLMQKVAAAQTSLRNGERLTFGLLSGAPAFYEANRISPRDAFLNLSLDSPFSIRKRAPENPSWHPYEIEILPNGTQQLLWELEVVLGFYGQIERIEMFQRPPHPF